MLLLGVADVKATKEFYIAHGLSVGKSFGSKYVEFGAAGSPVKLALYSRPAAATDAGVSADGTGSHRIVIAGGRSPSPIRTASRGRRPPEPAQTARGHSDARQRLTGSHVIDVAFSRSRRRTAACCGTADSRRCWPEMRRRASGNWDAAAAHAGAYLATLRGAEQENTRRAYGQVLRRRAAEFGAGTVHGDISVGQVAGKLRPR